MHLCQVNKIEQYTNDLYNKLGTVHLTYLPGMRKFWIDQDLRNEHWPIVYIESMLIWLKFNFNIVELNFYLKLRIN